MATASRRRPKGAPDLRCSAGLERGGSFSSGFGVCGTDLRRAFRQCASRPFSCCGICGRGDRASSRPDGARGPRWSTRRCASRGRCLAPADTTRGSDARPGGGLPVAVALGAQPDLLFLHAASFAVDGRGGLLVGRERAASPTTVLAPSPHAAMDFLGDDLRGGRMPRPSSCPFRSRRECGRGATRARSRSGERSPFAPCRDGVGTASARKYVTGPRRDVPRVHRARCGLFGSVFIPRRFAENAPGSRHTVPSLRETLPKPGWGRGKARTFPAGAARPEHDLVRVLRNNELLRQAAVLLYWCLARLDDSTQTDRTRNEECMNFNVAHNAVNPRRPTFRWIEVAAMMETSGSLDAEPRRKWRPRLLLRRAHLGRPPRQRSGDIPRGKTHPRAASSPPAAHST
jgi:hypothetical protein